MQKSKVVHSSIADYIQLSHLVTVHLCSTLDQWCFPSNFDTVDLLRRDPGDQRFLCTRTRDN